MKTVEELNQLLPVDERLEPISVHIPYNEHYQAQFALSQEDNPPSDPQNRKSTQETEELKEKEQKVKEETSEEVEEAREIESKASEPSSKAPQEVNEALKEQNLLEGGTQKTHSLETGEELSGSNVSITSNDPKKFRLDLIEETQDKEEDGPLVVHTSKKKKGKKKKPVEIS